MGPWVGPMPPQLRSLGYFVGPDAAGADPDPPDSAIHDGANPLEVGLESARPDVMGVAKHAADNGGLSANFTLFCHG
jgi:hypothetical protein